MIWTIRYFNEAVQKEVFSLPKSLLARYARLTDAFLVYGPNLGYPHTKSLGGSLFELRLKGKDGIARVFYCVQKGNDIIMLHSYIKKTQKTPKQALSLAISRLQEIKK